MYNTLVHIASVLDMENINISDFRSNLLKYLKLAQSGKSISVTSNGQVLATIGPPVKASDAARSKLNALSKTAVIDDVISPIDESWNAFS